MKNYSERKQVRIEPQTHQALKIFAKEKEIDFHPMLNRALNRVLKEHPEFFLPR